MLEQLYLCGNRINKITGLESMNKLKVLELGANRILVLKRKQKTN